MGNLLWIEFLAKAVYEADKDHYESLLEVQRELYRDFFTQNEYMLSFEKQIKQYAKECVIENLKKHNINPINHENIILL